MKETDDVIRVLSLEKECRLTSGKAPEPLFQKWFLSWQLRMRVNIVHNIRAHEWTYHPDKRLPELCAGLFCALRAVTDVQATEFLLYFEAHYCHRFPEKRKASRLAKQYMIGWKFIIYPSLSLNGNIGQISEDFPRRNKTWRWELAIFLRLQDLTYVHSSHLKKEAQYVLSLTPKTSQNPDGHCSELTEHLGAHYYLAS